MGDYCSVKEKVTEHQFEYTTSVTIWEDSIKDMVET